MSVEQYSQWLKFHRSQRDILFRISNETQKLESDFGYLRLEGLKALMEILESLHEEETAVFLTSQEQEDNNLCVYTLKSILKKIQSQPSPQQQRIITTNGISTPISIDERKIALRILQFVARLQHSTTSEYLVGVDAPKILMNFLQDTKFPTDDLDCVLDVIYFFLQYSSRNLRKDFQQNKVFEKVKSIQLQYPGSSTSKICQKILYYVPFERSKETPEASEEEDDEGTIIRK